MSPLQFPDESPSAPAAPPAGDLETLRDLLFGQEKQQLSGLQQRLENPLLHAQDVSRVLPQAVTLASAQSSQFATALTPAVESALQESVRRDPSTLINAVFPIIGPAIRKSIAEAFDKLVQSLNQTLDHSFSWQGLRWRLEAARSGRSFAEVVLAHTLVYRVEQVFLIHKPTGLLLQHVRAPNIKSEDVDMVSGLLTAIQDFAQDSFHVPPGEALHTLQVGEMNVWLETSPLITLAAVIRGQAPHDFRAVLQGALEKMHREQSATLEAFQGDASPFELTRPHLESCLQAHFLKSARPFPSMLLLVLGLVVVLLGAWGLLVMRDHRRWAAYVQRLKSEPGIAVTETGKRGGKFYIEGLRDPLAGDPARFLGEFKVNRDKIASRWEVYQSLHPDLLLRRALTILQPPAGVTLRVRGDVLFADGLAPAGWIERVRRRASNLPGIHAFDTGGSMEESFAVPSAPSVGIEQAVLFFEGGLRLAAGQELLLDSLAAQINDLIQTAALGGQRVRVSVIGHSDKSGTDELNLRLSRQRADHVIGLLASRGVPAGVLAATGLGAKEPLRGDLPEQEQVRNRRVSFRVFLDAEPSNNAAP